MLEYEEYYIFNFNSSDYQAHTLSATHSHKFGEKNTQTYIGIRKCSTCPNINKSSIIYY